MSASLVGVTPELIAAVSRVLDGMAACGFPMMVTDALRTTERQQALYAQGRTAPGPVVTRADGVIKRSNHQPHDDGWGYAVDCCFVVDGRPSWDDDLPWRLYGEMAKACGCQWGGDWTTPDRPHLEWPKE